MADDRDGFLKLAGSGSESRRNSLFNHHISVEESRSQRQDAKLRVGPCCCKMKLSIEREDGTLSIGGISLANNFQAIMGIFGFFFIFAGVVLTIISYKTPGINAKVYESTSTREEGKIAGPIFIVIGSILFIIGLLLSVINWKLIREAKIQRNRFSLEGLPPVSSPDAQSELNYAKSITPNKISFSFPSSRRESLFPSNYYIGRRRTLPTISQAVPVGFVINGKISRFGRSSPVDMNGSLNEKKLETRPQRESSASSRRKASLSLRASLPIPLLGSPNFMKIRSITPLDSNAVPRTRSDEPFGSIVSLSGTGDIACFPRSPRFPPCREEGKSQFGFFEQGTETEKRRDSNRELPIITVNDYVNPLSKQ